MSEDDPQVNRDDGEDREAEAFGKFADAVKKFGDAAELMYKSLDKPIVAPDGTVASPTVMNTVKEEEENTTLKSIESLLQRLVDRAEEAS